MNTIEATIRAWQRTTDPKTDIQDEDWKTLFAMCNKQELDTFKAGMEHAANLIRQLASDCEKRGWTEKADANAYGQHFINTSAQSLTELPK